MCTVFHGSGGEEDICKGSGHLPELLAWPALKQSRILSVYTCNLIDLIAFQGYLDLVP